MFLVIHELTDMYIALSCTDLPKSFHARLLFTNLVSLGTLALDQVRFLFGVSLLIGGRQTDTRNIWPHVTSYNTTPDDCEQGKSLTFVQTFLLRYTVAVAMAVDGSSLY